MKTNPLLSGLILLFILSLTNTRYIALASNDSDTVNIMWLGHSSVELAAHNYKKIVFVDPWIENPAWGWFNITPPTRYANVSHLVDYIKEKNPTIVLFLLTCDHGDHIGELFQLTKELVDVSVQVKIVAIYELAYAYIAPTLGELGEQVVVNFGAGINIGGTIVIEGIKITMTDARHSSSENKVGAPAVGYIIEMNGLKFYHAGATALFGDMKLIGELYTPDVAFLPIGDVITMAPREAALATNYVHPKTTIPIHYATSPVLRGLEAAIEFNNYVEDYAPDVNVKILKPGEAFAYSSSTPSAENIGWVMYTSIVIAVAIICGAIIWRFRFKKRTTTTSISPSIRPEQ